jgi:translocation and assembly module TamB
LNAYPQSPFSNSFRSDRAEEPQQKRRRSRWQRILLWTVAAFGALLVVLAIGIYTLLHNAKFHAYLLRTAQGKATQAVGSEVQFRDYAFHWQDLGPTVELYGVVIHGAEPYPDPPLLQADVLRVQVTISSLWHRSWYVNDLLVGHPVLRVFADRRGQTNLPHPSKSDSNATSSANVFDLGIRHFALTQGEIYYNDQKSDLSADVHELALQVGFAALEQKYSGSLSYREGKMQWQGANPVVHNFDARFSATPAQFTLENATLSTQHSHLAIQATARNYAQPQINLQYNAVVDSGEFRRVLRNDALPSGIIHILGELNYQDEAGRPFLATVRVRGNLHSDELSVTNKTADLKIRNLAAEYTLQNGKATIAGIRAQLLGGAFSAKLTVDDVAGSAKANLRAKLQGASLSTIQATLGPSATQRAVLTGSASADAEATWTKAFDNVVAKSDVAIDAGLQPTQSGAHAPVPVRGSIHARYDSSRQLLALIQSNIQTPQTSILLNGTVSKKSVLQVRVEAQELHELEELAANLRSSDAAPLDLHGQATLTATITGSTRDPQIRGHLEASNMSIRGTSWKLLRAQVAASPSSASLESGELDPASKGRITFAWRSNLQQWTFTNASSFQTKIDGVGLDAAELAKSAGVTTQVAGILSVNLEAHGTELAPAGQGKIQLSRAFLAGEPIKTITVGLNADGTSLRAQGRIDLTAGSTTADVQYEPKQQSYRVSVRTAGIKLEDLETLKAKNLNLSGVLKINANGSGTLKDPGLRAEIEIPQLTVRGQTVNNLKLTADIANHLAKAEFASDVLGSHAAGHGTVQLNGDYVADIAIDTQTLPLQPVFAMLAPEQAADLSGQTEIHATLHGPLKNRSQLEAHVVIPQLKVSYKSSIQLAASEPIRADYVNGTFDVRRSVIRGTGTELAFQANLPGAKDAPVSVLLQGTVDLQLAQLFDPDLTAGGQLRFDINSYGQRSDPNVQGQVRIVNASFSEAGMPLGLRAGNGTLTLTRDRLNITEFKGQVGGGTVTAGGGIVYRPDLRFDLAMKAEGVRLLYQQSIRATLNSDLSLAGRYEDSSLRGQVSVEQLSFTSNFDLVNFASQLAGDEIPPATSGLTQNLHLQVAVQTPGGLSMSSRNLSVAGSADLQVRGTAAQPVLLGRVNVSDGDLIFYGNRYVLQGGTIDFRNPSHTEPVLNVSVNTTIQQYDIQLHLNGPIDHLRTNYSSDPALPPSDIINLIAFGKTSEASAANPSPTGTLGAQSLIASQVSGQVTGRIEKLAGISQLSVDPELGSTQQSPGARIAIQQRVTSKIFVTFAADVTGTQQEVIQVEYQLSRKTSVKAIRDQNGGFSLETSFRKEW